MFTVIAIIAVIVILSGLHISISVGVEDKEESLVPPHGLGGYVADPNIPNPKLLVPTRHNGGQSNSALLTLMKSLETKLSHEEPLKSDDLYEEPQATYPMEMRI